MQNLKFKTYTPKTSDTKEKKWYLVDVKGKTLGRVATAIADILRGKNKTTFSNHVDCGDYLIVLNAAEIKLTGNKETQKTYHSHSRHPGGFKSTTVAKMREKKPETILKNAVAGMISNNKNKKEILKKLKIFAGTEHSHQAQQPEQISL